MTKKKYPIVRIIARLNIGGPSIHTTLLTEELSRMDFPTTLVFGKEADTEGNLLELAYEKKILDRLKYIPSLGREINFFHDMISLFSLYRLLRKTRPYIVHTHTAKAGAVGRVAAKLARVPIVVHTFHGHILHGYFGKLKSNFFICLERFLARWTDKIIVVSGHGRDELTEKFKIAPSEKMLHIPLGLELDRFRSVGNFKGELRSELHLDANVPTVGIVARLVPIKGHEIFIKTAAEVHKEVPRAKFLIIGDGERREELVQIVEDLGLQDVVWFVGWREDLERVYADLDVVALTSYNEGLPVTIIESMASGKPVVATRVGGVPELVEDGVSGYLADTGDYKTLAKHMIPLLNDQEKAREMGEKAREWAFEKFGIKRLVKDIDTLYHDLIKAKGLD